MIAFVVEVVFRVFCGVTGHAVLWALTLGRWNVANGRDDLATIIGLLFWVAVGVVVWFAFFR
jgi:hypothetical protein